MRVRLYRLCGFRIGKNVFIGMKCYFDDVSPEKMIIEDNVGISYTGSISHATAGNKGITPLRFEKMLISDSDHLFMQDTTLRLVSSAL